MNINLYSNRILRPVAVKKKEDIFDSISITGMRASPGPGNISQPGPDPGGNGDTTPDGEQLIGILGDSIANGHATDGIPVVAADTLFNWTGSVFTEITTQPVSNGGSWGSAWQYFATKHKANSTYKTLLVNHGFNSTGLLPDTAGQVDTWDTSGTLYTNFVTEIGQALAAKSLTRPVAIFIVIGSNDIVDPAHSITDIQAGFDSLISRLQINFPGVPLLLVNIGREPANQVSQRLYDLRTYYLKRADEIADLHIFFHGIALESAAGLEGDNSHYNNAGNQWMGESGANWLEFTSYPKWRRSVQAAISGDMNANRRNLIDIIITGLLARGDFHKLETLSLYKNDSVSNFYLDLSLLGFSFSTGSTITLNQHLATSGSPNVHTNGWRPDYAAAVTGSTPRTGLNNMFMGVKLKVRNTPNGTACTLFGGIQTGSIQLGMNSANTVFYRTNNATSNTVVGEVGLNNDTFYGCYRDGANSAGMYKNNSVIDTNADASTAVPTISQRVGAVVSSGVNSSYLDGEYEYCVAGGSSIGANWPALYADLENCVDHWND